MQVAAVVNPPQFRELVLGVRVQIRPLLADGMAEQNFGGQARRWNAFFIEQLRTLLQCLRRESRAWHPQQIQLRRRGRPCPSTSQR